MKRLILKTNWCKKCGICVAFCPKKILAMGEDGVYVVDESKCIYCGMCEMRCPDFAIYVEENNE